jgi:hypothetical protein
MKVDAKIIEELKRFNQINRYILKEQDADPALTGGAEEPAPGGDAPADPALTGGDAAAPTDPAAGGDTAAPTDPAAGGEAPAGGTEVPEPVDIENDPDVEEVGAETGTEGDEETEEIDITDLVTSQQEMKEKQDELMDTLFSRLDDLQGKLEHMDQIMDKINSLENKFDKFREKTPEEKLMLRSLDSYPYNQKLTDFFDDKKSEMEETGKNEYVLTSDEVENFSPNEIKGTFNTFDEEEEKLEELHRRSKRYL